MQRAEYFGSCLAKGVILGMAFALLTGAGSGFAEGSAGDSEGHTRAREGIPWTRSGLVLWIEGFNTRSLLNAFLFVNAWHHLVDFFYKINLFCGFCTVGKTAL